MTTSAAPKHTSKFVLSEALLIAMVPVLAAALLYTRTRAFTEYYGVPAWFAGSDAATVGLVVLPLMAVLFLGGSAYLLGSRVGTAAAVTFVIGTGVLYGLVLAVIEGAPTLPTGLLVMLAFTVLLTVPASAGVMWRRRWSVTVAAGWRATLQRAETWAAVLVVVGWLAVALFAHLGTLDAKNRVDFLLTDGAPRWVVLQRRGDNLLAAQIDTTTGDLLGRYTLLPAAGDSAPVLTLCALGPFNPNSAGDSATGAARAAEVGATPDLGVRRWRSRARRNGVPACLRRPAPATRAASSPPPRDSLAESHPRSAKVRHASRRHFPACRRPRTAGDSPS